MMVRRYAASLTVTVALTAAGCGSSTAFFRGNGAGDGSSANFELTKGPVVIRYVATDGDGGLLGCRFSIDLLRQPSDSLGQGIPVASSESVSVDADGSANGAFEVASVEDGVYYLRLGRIDSKLGHLTVCAWELSVEGRRGGAFQE